MELGLTPAWQNLMISSRSDQTLGKTGSDILR